MIDIQEKFFHHKNLGWVIISCWFLIQMAQQCINYKREVPSLGDILCLALIFRKKKCVCAEREKVKCQQLVNLGEGCWGVLCALHNFFHVEVFENGVSCSPPPTEGIKPRTERLPCARMGAHIHFSFHPLAIVEERKVKAGDQGHPT